MSAQILRSLIPLLIALLLFITVLGQGCDTGLFKNSVNIVKNKVLDNGMTTEMWVASIAGAIGITGTTGKVKWNEFQPVGYESHIRLVEVNINLTIGHKQHSAKIQWLVNMDTKYVKLNYVETDGKATNGFLGMIDIWKTRLILTQ